MTRAIATAIALLAPALLVGCGQPSHLGYDFGRAYTEAVTAQADLTRPSVASSEYMLEGSEASKIRMQLEEATTDKAEPVITLSAD